MDEGAEAVFKKKLQSQRRGNDKALERSGYTITKVTA